MEWETDRGLQLRILLSGVLIVLLPFAFAYTMLFVLNTVGTELLQLSTAKLWNGRFYVRPWVIAIVVVVGFVLQYLLGEHIALSAVDADTVDRESYPELCGRVDRLSQQANMAVPDVAVSTSETPNAFTVGRRPFGSTVVVTAGLLDALSDEELDGVLAHELAHIKNRDVTVMTLAYFLPSLTYMLAIVAFTVLHGMFKVFGGLRHVNREGSKGVAIAILVLFVSSVVTLTISVLFWAGSFCLFRILSRYREYTADRGAAAITGEPTALASALRQIDDTMSELPDDDLRKQDGGLEALYVAPIDEYQFSDEHDILTSNIFPGTHPPVENRIDRLQEMATEVET